jgi:hypothetical protein
MTDRPDDERPRFTVIIPPDRPEVRRELEEELWGEGVRVVLDRRREERRPRDLAEEGTGEPLPEGAAGHAARVMYIVSREASDKFQFVERHFADEPGIEVMYDRRHRDRREQSGPAAGWSHERRQAERRQQDTDRDLRAVGWALVRLTLP